MASTIRCSSSPWGKDEGARLHPSLCSGEADTGWASRMRSRRVWFGNRMLGLGTWFALLHHITTTPTPTYIPFPSLPPRFPALRLPLPRPLPPLSSFLLSPPSLPSPPSPPPPLALCPPPPALTLARRVEGVCYFLASPDGASSPHGPCRHDPPPFVGDHDDDGEQHGDVIRPRRSRAER